MKYGVLKRAQKLFSDEATKAEVLQISFDNTCKILSDLIHFGYVLPIALRLMETFP